MSVHVCAVCRQRIVPALEENGLVRAEGITVRDTGEWVWGPVAVHHDHRTQLRMPHDSIEGDYVMTYGWVKA